MTESDGDGVIEELQRSSRIALTAAARVGETLSRVREHQLRRAAEQSQERAQALARQVAERQVEARSRYQLVEDPDWWRNAAPEQVAEVYRDAVTYAPADEIAAAAQQRIETEAAARYGVNLGDADPSQAGPRLQEAADELRQVADHDEAQAMKNLILAEAADQAAGTHEELAGETTDPDARNTEREEVGVDVIAREDLSGDAERAASAAAGARAEAAAAAGDGQVAGAESPEWDSRERRQATEAQMREVGVPDRAIQARMLADVSQAKPADEISKAAASKNTKARPARGQAAGRQRNQGLSR